MLPHLTRGLKMARIPWNKGLKGFRVCSEETKQKMSISGKGRIVSEETRLKMSLSRLGTHPTEETKEKLRQAHLGILGYKHTEETKQKIGKANSVKRGQIPWNKGVKGEGSPGWKGGITPINKIIRASAEFKNWRKAVFERDYWTCQICGKKKEITINAHHIKSFGDYPELRFKVDNGITYCEDCHKNSGFHKKLLTA